MDRKSFMKELAFLLQDINDQEREEALLFYENYFDEAGEENEGKIIEELGDPSKVAAMIKDGLTGQFDERIEAGAQGFSNDTYQKNYEVVDVEVVNKGSSFKDKFSNMETRDKILLLIILIIAVVPLSFPAFGLFSGLAGVLFSMAVVFTILFLGVGILTFITGVVAVTMIVLGVMKLFVAIPTGILIIGTGMLVLSLSMILEKIAKWYFKTMIPSIIDWLSSLFNSIFNKGGAQ